MSVWRLVVLAGAASAAFAVCGCVNQSRTLITADGRVSSCSAAGFGLVSMIMAQNRYDDCIAAAMAGGAR